MTYCGVDLPAPSMAPASSGTMIGRVSGQPYACAAQTVAEIDRDEG
jgi:hypothetical protein